MAETNKYLTGEDIGSYVCPKIARLPSIYGSDLYTYYIFNDNVDQYKYISRNYFENNIDTFIDSQWNDYTGGAASSSQFISIPWLNKYFICHHSINPEYSNNDFYDNNKNILIKDGEVYYHELDVDLYEMPIGYPNQLNYLYNGDGSYRHYDSSNKDINNYDRYGYFYCIKKSYNNEWLSTDERISIGQKYRTDSIIIPCGPEQSTHYGLWANFNIKYSWKFFKRLLDETETTLYPEPSLFEVNILTNPSNLYYINTISNENNNKDGNYVINIINSIAGANTGMYPNPTAPTGTNTMDLQILFRNVELDIPILFTSENDLELYIIKINFSRDLPSGLSSSDVNTLNNSCIRTFNFAIYCEGGMIISNTSGFNIQTGYENEKTRDYLTYNQYKIFNTISESGIGVCPVSSSNPYYRREYSTYIYCLFPNHYPLNANSVYNSSQEILISTCGWLSSSSQSSTNLSPDLYVERLNTGGQGTSICRFTQTNSSGQYVRTSGIVPSTITAIDVTITNKYHNNNYIYVDDLRNDNNTHIAEFDVVFGI